MKLIVGLGNPGRKYQNTRHNIGFMVIDRLMGEGKVSPRIEKKFSALVFHDHKRDLILARPTVFMNESGIAVARIANFYRLAPEDIWVIHDDVDLPLEKLKIVKKRGSAGHKGVMSIIKELGTVNFVRFRLGVGHPHSGRLMKGGKRVGKFDAPREVTDFVLAPFVAADLDEVRKLVGKTVEAIELALEEGLKKAMNRYN